MEEIQQTLHKHLAKEEDQLFPLLLKHFTFAEQVPATSSGAVICCKGAGSTQTPEWDVQWETGTRRCHIVVMWIARGGGGGGGIPDASVGGVVEARAFQLIPLHLQHFTFVEQVSATFNRH